MTNSKEINEETDRLIKLLSEYTDKLKSLLNLYNSQRKKRLNLVLFSFAAFLIILANIGLNLLFHNYFSFNTTPFYYTLAIILIVILLSYYMYYFLSEFNSKTDIIDEINYFKPQLIELMRIGSQVREHLIKEDSYTLLEIDLKLTEAEDTMRRVNKILHINEDNEKILSDFIPSFKAE